MEELRKLTKWASNGSLQYQSLANGLPKLVTELRCLWFTAGLSPGERQYATGPSAERTLRCERVELAAVMNDLRFRERRKAASPSLTQNDVKGNKIDPAEELLDIGL